MAKSRPRKKKPLKSGAESARDASKSRPQKKKPVASGPEKQVIASSRIAVWKLRTTAGSLQWSANSFRLFGLKNASLLPKTLAELTACVQKEDQERFRNAFDSLDHRKLLIDVRIATPGGSYCWLEFSSDGRAPKSSVVHGIIQDVTSQKLTEFELHDWKTRNDLVSASAGLLIYDYDVITGEIIWSGNTLQLVGFTSLEMGRIELWEQLIHPDDRPEAHAALEQSRNQLKPYDVYYRFRRKDIGYCYMHDRGQFVTNSEGVAVRMLGVMNDVSERVEADKIIQQSEKSYRELFNSVGEAIYIQRADGTFVDVNNGACEIYGYTKEELIGKNPGFIGAPGKNDFTDLRQKMESALRGTPQVFQWWGRKKNGDEFILEVKLTRGTYFGDDIIIATSWDITDKISAEISLQESERRFRRLIEDLNVGVVVQDPEGCIQIANKAALALLGRRESSLEGTFADKERMLVTEQGEPLEVLQLPWNFAARTRKAVRGVVLGIRNTSNQHVVWVLVNAEPILPDSEKLLHIVITLTDITERRAIEEDLKESELRFRTLQEASFGGIGLHKKGIIVDCNQGLCDITGFSYDELIGSNGLNLIAEEYRDFVYSQIINKVEQPYDVEGVRKDGTRYYLEIHGKNIPYEEGLIRVTEFRDITERKAAEAKILEQNAKLLSITEDLKLKNEQLQEFTQIVSHNLRSPVGNILSLLNFIENAETEEERTEYVTLLKEAGSTTLTTLHELNEVLQIKQNRNIERQKLDFEQVFVNVRRMLVARIVETNAIITRDFSAAPGIEYPNIYLESILLNLLSNALKYHHPDRKPVIHLKTDKVDGNTLLEVSDNGQGINMQRYGHQMFKLRKTFHKHPESRGIGLFMIKNQIEAMGGDISVSSIENEGTTFLIKFDGRITDDE